MASKKKTSAKVSRRKFLKTGVTIGSGVATVGGVGAVVAPGPAEAQQTRWHHEADVVVVGAGAAGFAAALSAHDQGASVIMVEQNFDIGGRAILSGAACYLGGGTWLQKQAGIEDSPDVIFKDWTLNDHPMNRYNDREIVRKYVDECVATFDFLTRHGVDWAPLGSPDRLDSVPRRPFPKPWPNTKEAIVPRQRGTGLMRPLEKSARAKGVTIILQHRMRTVIREQRLNGRILGISAVEVDKYYNMLKRTVNFRARKGVILTTGGHSANVNFRRIFDPRLTEEYQQHGDGWTPKNADGELAAMALGASLWGTANQTNESDGQLSKGRIGTRSNYHALEFTPESPNFFREKATGKRVGDWQNVILVKENGKRFYDETCGPRDYQYFFAAMQWTGDPNKLNGGGPIWAIFDAEGAKREKWTNLGLPSFDPDGYFFSADTVEELAAAIKNKYQWRSMPGNVLKDTVERYNSFADTGKDADFNKPKPLYKIQTPPFYAAWATPCVHDCYVGLRTNTNAQVLDLDGNVIVGLYAAGETQGGFGQHGLGRAFVYGRLAGLHAAGATGKETA